MEDAMPSRILKSAGLLAALAIFACALPAAAESTVGQNDQPIHDAARLGTADAVARLLKADPAQRDARTQQGSTPLHLAATNPDPGPLKVLVAAGAEVNARDGDGATPLHMAAYASHAKNVRLLLEAGADYTLKTNNGRDAGSMARKVMANEAAGVLSLWILKGCKAGQTSC